MKAVYDVAVGITMGLFLSGCAGSSLESNPGIMVYNFSSPPKVKQIVIAEHEIVVEMCGHGIESWDDGTKIKDKNKIGGCYMELMQLIVVDIRYPKILLHELCHAGGYPPILCHSVNWPKNKDLTIKESHVIIYKETKNARNKRVIKLP